MATPIYSYTPFVYLIGWSKLNKWYIGSRSSITENAHPSQLWTSYHTSSKHVKRFVKKNGDPDVIMVLKTFTDMESARNYEDKVLRRLDVKGRDDFLNKSNGLPGDHHGDNTGKRWIRNHQDISLATKERLLNPDEVLPEGWVFGSLQKTKGKRWIRNHQDISLATKERRINPNEPIPEGWYPGKLSYIKGYKAIYNHPDINLATEQRRIGPDEPVPEGWYRGKRKRNTKRLIRNHPDINLATKRKRIGHNELVPEGWYLGGLALSKAHKEKLSNKKRTGIWITPYGVFGSANDAAKNSPYNVSNLAIKRWCKFRNKDRINKHSLARSEYLQKAFNPEDIVGKTFADIGFGFEPYHKS